MLTKSCAMASEGAPITTQWKLLTFGEGSNGYRAAARRLGAQATATGMFEASEVIDGVSIRKTFPNFWEAHGRFMASNPRGFGYWVWKPFVILEALKALPAGWGVAYLDGGCVLNDTPAARKRLEDYKSHALEHSVWATELIPQPGRDYSNETWCKADALHYLGASQAVRQMNQIQAGMLLLANDPVSRQLVELWHQVSLDNAYHYLDNSPSVEPNAESFREHRHDQALLNIIFRQMELKAIPDETFHPGAWSTQGSGFPIWAPRWTFTAPFDPNQKRPLSVRIETVRRLGLKKSIQIALQRVSRKQLPSGRTKIR